MALDLDHGRHGLELADFAGGELHQRRRVEHQNLGVIGHAGLDPKSGLTALDGTARPHDFLLDRVILSATGGLARAGAGLLVGHIVGQPNDHAALLDLGLALIDDGVGHREVLAGSSELSGFGCRDHRRDEWIWMPNHRRADGGKNAS